MALQGQVASADGGLPAWTDSMQIAAGHTASRQAPECRALYQLHAIRVSDVRPRCFACVVSIVLQPNQTSSRCHNMQARKHIPDGLPIISFLG